jgi:hypothetical protein
MRGSVPWFALAALVGVSFALPLFLGFRAQTEEKGLAAP